MDTLNPCPFCGGTNLYIEGGVFNANGDKGYYVGCKDINCTAEGPWDLGKSGAVEKWNDRTDNKTISAYACLIDEYLRGYISHDEFVTECKKLPKLTTTHPLPGVLVER